jgi:hypothetical protein
MRDLTEELLAIQQTSDTKNEWSARELLGVIRPGRIIWERINTMLLRSIDQANLQKIPIDTHFVPVTICSANKPAYPDCKLSGYGAYLFLNELKPSELVRSALAYFCRYASPSAPAPVDELLPEFVELPSISLRTRLTAAVRAYAAKFSLDFDFAWNQVYTQHRYRYKVDIKQRAKNAGIKTLDWADQNSKIAELLAIANYLLEPKSYSLTPLEQEVS